MDKKSRNRLPTEKRKGVYNRRQTFLGICPCGCGDPSAFFVDKPKKVCGEQTLLLRAKAMGISLKKYLRTQVEEIHRIETALVIFQTPKGVTVVVWPKRTPLDPEDVNL